VTIASAIVQRFLADLPNSAGAADAAAVARALEATLSRARSAWPGIDVAPEAFFAFVARRIDEGSDLIEALGRLRAEDLYLACGCVQGDLSALQIFDREVLALVDGALHGMRLGSDEIAELKQAIRHDLFVGREGENPRIEAYGGRGRLAGWLRVSAVRRGLNQLRKDKRLRPLGDAALEEVARSEGDVELHHIKGMYREDFKAAFSEALSSLGARHCNVLRHHYVDGLTTVQIGAIYRVHQSTASRWIKAATRALLHRTREGLMQRLELDPDGCDSLMQLLHSQLDITISRYLKNGQEGGS
jgi:RNA polymerase sigma-70 factor (ECF subfamily)